MSLRETEANIFNIALTSSPNVSETFDKTFDSMMKIKMFSQESQRLQQKEEILNIIRNQPILNHCQRRNRYRKY